MSVLLAICPGTPRASVESVCRDGRMPKSPSVKRWVVWAASCGTIAVLVLIGAFPHTMGRIAGFASVIALAAVPAFFLLRWFWRHGE